MSVASEITRLNTAKADIKEAIEGYGITVPSTDTIDTYAAKVADISGGEWLPSAETVLATFARRQSGGDGPATIEKVYGKTIIWNQLIKDYTDSGNLIALGDSSIAYTGGQIVANLASTSSLDAVGIKMKGVTPGHTYAILTATSGTLPTNYKLGSASGAGSSGITFQNFGQTIRATSASQQVPNEDGALWFFGTQTSFSLAYLRIIDLTKMYGEGKEPSTVAEFLSMHPEALTAPYDAGSLLPVKAEKIVTQGVNAFDKGDALRGVRLDDATGAEVAHTGWWCSGWIRCLPNTTYYVSHVVYGGVAVGVHLYDAEKNHITGKSITASHTDNYDASGTFTTTEGSAYIRLRGYLPNGSIDIYCLNISDTSINGQYFPHHNSDVGLPILKHFPTGLRGVGDSYDEIGPKMKVQRRGVVDLGSLGWSGTGTFFSSVIEDMAKNSSIEGMICAKYKPRDSRPVSEDKAYYRDGGRIFIQDSAYTTAAGFKTAVSGVEFEYPLAEPIETDINEDMTYLPQLGGTEEVSPISAEFKAEIRYARKISE